MIHPTAIIGENVQIENDVYIGPHCLITGRTRIEAGTRIEGFASIGTPAEHADFFETEGECRIGIGVRIREFVTVNAGSSGITEVKDRAILLRGAHVGHDSIVGSDTTISCNVLIGGRSHIMRGANLGLGSILHQFSIIGAYAMLGMGTIVTKASKIHPGLVYKGAPARFLKQNHVGLSRFNVNEGELQASILEYEELRNGR